MTKLRSATGVTEVVTVELLPGVRSVRLADGVAVAVLLKVPVALPETVPEMVKVTVLDAGKVATVVVTVLPKTLTAVGHTAPPVLEVQLAVTPVMPAGTASLIDVPPAALGPALLRVTE